MTNQTWTIKRILEWSAEYLSSKGIEQARLESELLLSFLLKLRRLDLYLQFERPLSKDELSEYKSVLKRRLDDEPCAYIVGKKEFWSRDFFVSSDVLIPRPDTEILVETILDHIKRDVDSKRLWSGFEIGLGSGAIAITLAAEVPTLRMHAVDVSVKAVEVAARNATYHGLDARLKIDTDDFLSNLYQNKHTESQFDFIVSNPPYIRDDEFQGLPKTVRDYEPKTALVSGTSGLEFYGQICDFANRTLTPNGRLAVEIGENQGQDVKRIFENYGFQNICIKQDLAQRDRVVTGVK